MRKVRLAVLVLLSISASAPAPALAKDWGQMNVKERLAWADQYASQVCPYGLDVPKEDGSRQNEIGDTAQIFVELYINFHCRSTPVAHASS